MADGRLFQIRGAATGNVRKNMGQAEKETPDQCFMFSAKGVASVKIVTGAARLCDN